jgi:hypothetical protein
MEQLRYLGYGKIIDICIFRPGPGSAGQAGEPGRRVPAASRAPRHELRWGEAEDGGPPLDLLGGEVSLPAVATAFGGAHGGVTGPAHQFTELGPVPAVLLAKDPDVRADDDSLLLRDLIDAAEPPGSSRTRLPDDDI